jgi:hypothetical protein
MSDIKKWMKIVESVAPTLMRPPTRNDSFKANDTVSVSPRVGGGVGRFMEYTQEGALIDIKGIARELPADDYSELTRDEDTGNDWFHASQEDDTIGTMNDKPEFRPGDMVKIADVYGAVIGPGFGVFVAYSTDGKDCIVSFDGKSILVPTANVSSVLEQDAKDNFGEMDNDGNLSPMSLGSQNVKLEVPAMDQRDEFSKWMASIEEALSDKVDEEILEQGSCGCGAWNCPDCFPDEQGDLGGLEGQQIPAIIVIQPQDGGMEQPDAQQMPPQGMPEQPPEQPQGVGMAGTHPVDGDTFGHDEDDEIDVTMMGDEAFGEDGGNFEMEQDTTPRSGKGVKLGHIVQKFVKADVDGQDAPLTHGGDLEEDGFDDDEVSYDDAAPIAQQNYSDEMSQIDPDEAMEIIGKIKYMQDMGLSKSNRTYSEDELAQLPAVKLKQVQQEVMGGMSDAGGAGEMEEATDAPKPKPTKVKQKSPFDDMDDVLGGSQDQPLAKHGGSDDGEYNDTMDRPGAATPSMPRASAASTRAKTAGITPSDTMRDYMSRIAADAGGDEPELAQPQDQENAMVARTARDVPQVISSAMQASGTQVPEWHTVNNLPGYQQQNVRGMGRQIFGMFTRTPLEQIQTIANVNGQGPNTDAEMRAVASWLQQNADDLGEVELSHGRAIPGYKPDVKEYSLNGVRFHVVRDPMGQYIYAYPDADATTNQNNAILGGQGGAGPTQGRLPGAMPRLREGSEMGFKLTITEAIKLDDIIREGLDQLIEQELEESSLSKLIGKQHGGQKLVQWLHRKHKLGNDADLQPQPFSERMMWKEFKRNPDNFIVVSATNGVAGIKPYEKQLRDRMEAARRKGKDYDPGGDSTLQYQIIAFTDDGQQVDPALLQPAREPGEEREVDPTVMKARMGKISGKDTQNSDNVFNLLADQIGTLRTVYLVAGGVERSKMKARDELGAGPNRQKAAQAMPEAESLSKLFGMVRPVLKKLASEALSPLMRARVNAVNNDNDDQVEKLSARIKKIKEFIMTIDTSKDVNVMNTPFGPALRTAIGTASGAPTYSQEFKDYLSQAASGSRAALKPVLDALRDEFFAKLK